MQARIDAKALATLAKRTAQATGKVGSTSATLLEVDGGSLVGTATDYELAIRATAGCTDARPGRILVNGQRLAAVAAAMPDGEVLVETNADNGLRISSGRVVYDLDRVAADDEALQPFAEAEVGETTLVPAAVLGRCLAASTAFVSKATDKPALQCVSVRKGEIKASTGYAVLRMRLEQLATVDLLVPGRGAAVVGPLAAALGADAELAVLVANSRIVFVFDDVSVLVKQPNETFPAVERVFDAAGKATIVVDRDSFATALRRVLPMSGSVKKVVFDVSLLDLGLQSDPLMRSQVLGSAKDVIGLVEPAPGALVGHRFAVDGRFVLDALEVLGPGKVEIGLGPNNSQIPVVFRGFERADPACAEIVIAPMHLDR